METYMIDDNGERYFRVENYINEKKVHVFNLINNEETVNSVFADNYLFLQNLHWTKPCPESKF